ncbi:hypothetical protein ABGT15_10340 [Flavobacterium enshiense]|uniref:hypothetical protein n=1 Tax=Flavobacterium enshiense TaxID=1341165 RepID=UPI00345C6E42
MIAVSFKLYKTSKENEILERKLSVESTLHHNQIAEILKRYDSVNLEPKTPVSKEIVQVQESVTGNKHLMAETVLVRKGKAGKANVTVSKGLKAINVNARGVRMVSDDVLETNSFSKIDQVRICFTLEENKNIEIGKKQIQLQILNPKKRYIDLDNRAGSRLVKEIYYDRLKKDACIFVDLYQHELIVGDYTINLVHNEKVIGSTVFHVN